MKVFTAKQIHDDPTPIYQAALQGPVKITHKHHGDFVMVKASVYQHLERVQKISNSNTKLVRTPCEFVKHEYPDTLSDDVDFYKGREMFLIVGGDVSRFPAVDNAPIVRSDGNILVPIGDNKFVVKSPDEVGDDSGITIEFIDKEGK